MVELRVPPTFGPRLGHGMMAESPGMKRSSESTLAPGQGGAKGAPFPRSKAAYAP